ncbi:hypothetical protein BC936DRAFT_143321 [Jimgerdemannia flammicorona]|uniref:Integral membrane protein n=1 Tax=Jimgerdemannia flammicorona TaxID=994334 RepID=A0A433DE30_9FUNG|nr:hypothetical protein BC936DRAFT_143321 [Jimgerdemannia flammicorona]
MVSAPPPAPASRTFLALYLSALSTNPLRTKAATAGILAGLQELIGQRLSGQKSKNGDIIDLRVIQMTAYGLFVSGPLGHYLFELLTKAFKGQTGTPAKVGQILVSNLIMSPIQNAGESFLPLSTTRPRDRSRRLLPSLPPQPVYLSVMAMIAGARTREQVFNAVRTGLFPMMKVSWVVSPITMALAQKFLPVTLWVPFFNIVSFVFGTYVNTMTKRKRLQQELQQEREQERKRE